MVAAAEAVPRATRARATETGRNALDVENLTQVTAELRLKQVSVLAETV